MGNGSIVHAYDFVLALFLNCILFSNVCVVCDLKDNRMMAQEIFFKTLSHFENEHDVTLHLYMLASFFIASSFLSHA